VILIPCPWCGPRNSNEFAYGHERKLRPNPGTTSQAEWRAYLYDKRNPAGWTSETWYHRAGCRKFLLVERHTVTNQIRSCTPAAPLGLAATGPSASVVSGSLPDGPEPEDAA